MTRIPFSLLRAVLPSHMSDSNVQSPAGGRESRSSIVGSFSFLVLVLNAQLLSFRCLQNRCNERSSGRASFPQRLSAQWASTIVWICLAATQIDTNPEADDAKRKAFMQLHEWCRRNERIADNNKWMFSVNNERGWIDGGRVNAIHHEANWLSCPSSAIYICLRSRSIHEEFSHY